MAFSKNLAYKLGGAEYSLWQILKEESIGNHLTIVSCRGVKAFNADKYRIECPENMEIRWILPRVLMKRFFYWEYVLNRSTIKKYFAESDAGILYAQNIWAPAALNSFSGRKAYFIRDEGNVNIRKNYHRGIRRLGKYLYDLLEWPAYLLYCRDNHRAIKTADRVICNSVYMSEVVKAKFGRDCDIRYPAIDSQTLMTDYEQKKSEIEDSNKGVVLIGETHIKGIDTVKALARIFPRIRFYVFGRSISRNIERGNLFLMPWQENPADVYKYARMVIVPSRWNEAYGRAAAEAIILDLPVIVANKGGLPEAVNYDERKIAYSFGDYIRCIETVFTLNK